jgi:FkbM family methyltransferase
MSGSKGWFPWWRVRRATAWGHALVSRQERETQRLARVNLEHIRDMELIMASVLRRASNCVDVGCHGGSMLRWMLRVAPDGQHIAVEPIPHLAEALRQKFPTVTVHEAALSDRAGTAEFDIIDDDLALSGFGRKSIATHGMRTRTITVRTMRLDDLLPPDLPVHLVKIDVEGAELPVLEGAVHTLKSWKPYVLLEHGSGPNDGAIYELLAGCGLALFTVDGRGPLDRASFGRYPDSWDYMARPW